MNHNERAIEDNEKIRNWILETVDGGLLAWMFSQFYTEHPDDHAMTTRQMLTHLQHLFCP